MAKAFTQLKNPTLAPTDQLPIGKYKGCRICDLAPDFHDYLIWLEKEKFVHYSKETVTLIQKHAGFAEEARHYEEEVVPYMQDAQYASKRDYYDDLPF